MLNLKKRCDILNFPVGKPACPLNAFLHFSTEQYNAMYLLSGPSTVLKYNHCTNLSRSWMGLFYIPSVFI